jgi:hypothetical protein
MHPSMLTFCVLEQAPFEASENQFFCFPRDSICLAKIN